MYECIFESSDWRHASSPLKIPKVKAVLLMDYLFDFVVFQLSVRVHALPPSGHGAAMAPKLQPYWIFVSAMKKQSEKEGTEFSEQECGHLWKDMGPEERAPYIEVSKQKNAGHSRNNSTSNQGALGDVTSGASASGGAASFQPDSGTVLAAMSLYFSESLAEAMGKSVVIAACNTLIPYDGNDEFCIPLEIALVTYSVSKGIQSMFHKFTDPGAVPVGCVYESRRYSQQTHAIPAVDFSLAISKDQLHQLVNGMSNLLRKCYKGTLPILLFTRANMVRQVRASLAFYAKEAKHGRMQKLLDERKIMVIDVAYLVGHMSMLAQQFVTLAECHNITNSVMFDYKNRCQFHHATDNNYCALSLCCRWAYLMSDYLLSLRLIDISPIPGRHLPVADTSAIHHGDYCGISFWSDDALASADESMEEASPEPVLQPSARSRVSGSGATGFSLTRGGRVHGCRKPNVSFKPSTEYH